MNVAVFIGLIANLVSFVYSVESIEGPCSGTVDPCSGSHKHSCYFGSKIDVVCDVGAPATDVIWFQGKKKIDPKLMDGDTLFSKGVVKYGGSTRTAILRVELTGMCATSMHEFVCISRLLNGTTVSKTVAVCTEVSYFSRRQAINKVKNKTVYVDQEETVVIDCLDDSKENKVPYNYSANWFRITPESAGAEGTGGDQSHAVSCSSYDGHAKGAPPVRSTLTIKKHARAESNYMCTLQKIGPGISSVEKTFYFIKSVARNTTKAPTAATMRNEMPKLQYIQIGVSAGVGFVVGMVCILTFRYYLLRKCKRKGKGQS